MNDTTAKVHVARCTCGQLRAGFSGAPVRINACSCAACQRRSGSAFTYSAFFPDAARLALEGRHSEYREIREMGRWQDFTFCPVCGVTVCSRLEAMPGLYCVPVGVLSDPGFAAPEKFYWVSKRHHWLPLPADAEAIIEQ